MENIFGTIEKISAPQQVMQKLKEVILSGKLPYGSRLPSERKLAEMLNVSRPVLREAIVMLSSYGLTYSKQGEGTFIVDDFPQSVLAFMGFDKELNKDNFRYFFECRKMFESGMASHVVENTTDDNINNLVRINSTFRSSEYELQDYVNAEIEFHSTFMKIAGNPLVLQLYSLVVKFMYSSAAYLLSDESTRTETFLAHNRIIEMIRERNADSIHEAVNDHLVISLNNLDRFFKKV